MFRSLRVRLPLLFLAGVALAGIVTTLIAIQLFRDYAHDRTITELRREANGIAQLYSSAVAADFGATRKGDSRRAPDFARKELERATGDLIYFDGPVNPFPGEKSGLRHLDIKTIDWTSGRALTFEFTPPSLTRLVLRRRASGQDRQDAIGAIIVAKKKTDVNQQVLSLVRRLGIAGILGLAVAAALAGYLSRRIVRPVLSLSRAADEVAAGNYDVETPANAPGEIGHLSERFDEMASRLKESEARERNFLMSVSHELRTPLTAIRGHVLALSEGLVEDPELRARSFEIVEAEATRLERLVGDILDLARLDAHRFTVLREEVGMEQLVEQAYSTFQEQARAPVDRLPRRPQRQPGDRLRRRPRAPDRRQPALERLPRDARRRPDPARARPDQRHGRGRRRGHGARDPRGRAGAALPAVRLGRRQHGAGTRRSRGSSRPRSAAGSSWTRSSAAARGSS